MSDNPDSFPIADVDSVPDPVSSPIHYRSHPSGVEAITIAEHFSYCLGNVIKYIFRADLKGTPVQDLKKAKWYLEREIQNREKKEPMPSCVHHYEHNKEGTRAICKLCGDSITM